MLQDPVDGEPAVLVKLYNVTQQKQMEAELQTQKEALARSDAELSVCATLSVGVCVCVHLLACHRSSCCRTSLLLCNISIS